MNKNKVSIIVALYKSEPFMKKCVDSIIQQTYTNIEIILVDDGSPDNCGILADEYQSLDKRVKVIHKKNGGACEARNYGIEASTGDFIVIVDGDDWLSPDYIEYLMNIILTTKAEMAMTDHIFTTRDQKQIKNDSIEVISSETAIAKMIYPVIPIGPWNKLYSAKLIKNNNISFSVAWSGEGLYFSTMAAQYAKQIGLGHRKIYNYRLNNSSSGLTHYNIQMGINALENIKKINMEIKNKTPKIQNAINWHIWKNYNFLLKLIIATDSVDENRILYNNCLKNIKESMISVFLNSEVSIKGKIRIIVQSLFPKLIAKGTIRNERKKLVKDKMR